MSATITVPVVLRYKDGRMEKCHVSPYFSHSLKVVQVIHEDKSVITVPIQDLKAVFFVQELDGKAHPEGEEKGEDSPESRAGRTVSVTFADGEKMRGKVLGDINAGAGFFLYPLERDCNNLKVFIVHSAAREIAPEE